MTEKELFIAANNSLRQSPICTCDGSPCVPCISNFLDEAGITHPICQQLWAIKNDFADGIWPVAGAKP